MTVPSHLSPFLEKHLRNCVVRLQCDDFILGTGFLVAPGLLVTCAHVVYPFVEKHRPIDAYLLETNTSMEASIVACNQGTEYPDLALLEITSLQHGCVRCEETIAINDVLYAYGFPQERVGGDSLTLAYEGPSDAPETHLKFKLGEAVPGMSGSPLLNIRTGSVCGILCSNRANPLLGGRAIPISVLWQAFPDLKAKHDAFHIHNSIWDFFSPPAPRAVSLWNIPYARNPLFTGQVNILAQIEKALHASGVSALSQPQAISGLGGIGKTQIAVEYAFQHRQDYKAVLWSRADTRESLISGYVEIADVLNLSQRKEPDQARAVKRVFQWLALQTGWLLILDNADDLRIISEFLPASPGGHVLLTTRAQSMGRLAQRIEVKTMDRDTGALLLLRCAGLIQKDETLEAALPSDRALARALTQKLDGLPLALDQAGAYIEAISCSLSEYLALYQTQRTRLLSDHLGLVDDHPESVATTWSLSFEKVKQQNAAAADFLRFCAYLAPDAIPEEIFLTGYVGLGEHLQPLGEDYPAFHHVLTILRAYSLIHHEPETKTVRVHRLAQAVLKDQMEKQAIQQWSEQTMWIIKTALPLVERENWPQWERLLAHSLECYTLIEDQQVQRSAESVFLLQETGRYLIERARYVDAEPLYKRALVICEQRSGAKHPSTATSLNNLAGLYERQWKYVQAEPLYKRALAIREQRLGVEHPDTVTSLNNLAGLYERQGKYTQAEPLYEQALAIREQRLGVEHPDTVISLNNLAGLYERQGKYAQAEPLYEQALAICEQQLGEAHPDTVNSLNNLASLYKRQWKYAQVEPLYKRALAICEQQLGAEHLLTANSLNNLAGLYKRQGKYAQAEPLYKRALVICEQQLGDVHPDTVNSLNNLASLYECQEEYAQAGLLYERALAICEQQLGVEYPSTVNTLNNLAFLYERQGKYAQADSLYERALAIREQRLGAEHPSTATSLNNLAYLCESQGEYAQSGLLYERALAICEHMLGPNHPATQTIRINYGGLLQKMRQENNN